MPTRTSSQSPPASSQDGFALVGLIVAIFIILLSLSIAAPTVARALRREREVEAVHRANGYVNAIRRYRIKTGAFPGSIEQLEKTNNIRYIRQKYNDPMTGKSDWRLIKVGENKTIVKGFFGQPLAGLASTGIGSGSTSMSGSGSGSSPMSPNGSGTSPFGSGIGSTGSAAAGSAPGGSPTDSNSTNTFGSASSTNSAAAGANSGFGSNSSPNSSGIGGQSASSFSGSGAPFMGVGLPTAGSSIIVVNEQTTYPEWEFLYDPRVEQLKAKVNLFGGGMTSASSSSLGALSGSQSSPQSNSNTLSGPPTPLPTPK